MKVEAGADHFGPREPDPRLVRVASPERRILMPNPPIGQFSEERVLRADLKELERIATERGLRLNSEKTTVPAHLELPSLFKSNRWERMGSKQELAIAPMWTRENNIRFALLQLDGRSAVELSRIFKISLVAAKGRMTSMRRWLTPELVEVPGAARMARKWHELLHPPDKDSQQMLRKLQQRAGMIPLDLIFRHPGERSSEREEKSREGRTVAARTMTDYDLAIKILHMRFIEKLEPQKILEAIEPDVGVKSLGTLSAFYSKVLTDDAQEMFGIKEYKQWSLPQYVKAASAFLSNENVEYREVAKALSRPEGSTRIGIYSMGKRLIDTRPEYKKTSPLAAFILEYGPKHLFPLGEDPVVVAERIYALHTRDESAPAAHMHTKRRASGS